MHRLPQHLIAALALFALLGAQVFGLQRGYLCDCGGEAQQTAYEHCHGPHSSACHDHESACSAAEEEQPSDTDTHHHPPVTVSLKFSTQKGGLTAPVMVAAPLAVCIWDSLVSLPVTQQGNRPSTPRDDRSPPECLRVARTVVMLI